MRSPHCHVHIICIPLPLVCTWFIQLHALYPARLGGRHMLGRGHVQRGSIPHGLGTRLHDCWLLVPFLNSFPFFSEKAHSHCSLQLSFLHCISSQKVCVMQVAIQGAIIILRMVLIKCMYVLHNWSMVIPALPGSCPLS